MSALEKAMSVTVVALSGLSAGLSFSRLMEFPHTWEAVTAITAFVALVIASVGYLDNRKAQRLEHRAYLRLDISDIGFDGDGALIANFVVSNYGRTPARGIIVNLEARVRDEHSRERSMQGALVAIETVHIGKGVERRCHMMPGIGRDLAQRVESGGSTLELLAWFDYRDVFEQVQRDWYKGNFRDILYHDNGYSRLKLMAEN